MDFRCEASLFIKTSRQIFITFFLIRYKKLINIHGLSKTDFLFFFFVNQKPRLLLFKSFHNITIVCGVGELSQCPFPTQDFYLFFSLIKIAKPNHQKIAVLRKTNMIHLSQEHCLAILKNKFLLHVILSKYMIYKFNIIAIFGNIYIHIMY